MLFLVLLRQTYVPIFSPGRLHQICVLFPVLFLQMLRKEGVHVGILLVAICINSTIYIMIVDMHVYKLRHDQPVHSPNLAYPSIQQGILEHKQVPTESTPKVHQGTVKQGNTHGKQIAINS